MSIQIVECSQKVQCLTCGKAVHIEFRYTKEMGVCGDCAHIIANLYQFKHGGKYLTPDFESRVKGGEFDA